MLRVALEHDFGGFRLAAEFDAPAGVTALFGRSGSGKTSVVNAVAGLLSPDRGRIELDGTVLLDSAAGIDLPVHRRRIGYVFQEARLFPHLTVRQNLLYGRWMRGGGAAGDLDRVVDLLGLAALLSRRPAGLSGGEKSRVAIGRALLSAPRMLLMDEPLASLDEARKLEILPYLERLRDEGGLPILYVSHSLAEVARLATTLVVLDGGRVLRAGPAGAVLSDPAAVPSLGLREAGSILQGTVEAHEEDGLTRLATSAGPVWLPRVAAPAGAAVRFRVSAQDVMIALERPAGISALNVLPARIVALRQGDGPGVLVQLQAGGDLLLARITRRSADALALAPDMPVFAVVKSLAVAQQDVGLG
jgi:molybdate transport system ATP-binding protein